MGFFVCLLQVAQVLLTLPYSFSQLGMLSGVLLQLFYGFLGSWTAYLISVLYVEYRSRKEKEGVSFKNHVIQVPPPICHIPCRARLACSVALLQFSSSSPPHNSFLPSSSSLVVTDCSFLLPSSGFIGHAFRSLSIDPSVVAANFCGKR